MTVAAPIALMPGSAVFLELPLAGLLFAVAHHLLHFTVHRAHAARASSAAPHGNVPDMSILRSS
jgi:hypothetical protein